MPDQRVTYRRRHSYRTKTNKILLCVTPPPALSPPPACRALRSAGGRRRSRLGWGAPMAVGAEAAARRIAPSRSARSSRRGLTASVVHRKKTPGGVNAVHYQKKTGTTVVRLSHRPQISRVCSCFALARRGAVCGALSTVVCWLDGGSGSVGLAGELRSWLRWHPRLSGWRAARCAPGGCFAR